jgi:hypothetical protein
MTKEKSLFDTLFEANVAPYTQLMKLAAIWLEKPVKTSIEKKRRITKGDLISISNGKLIDCEGNPTHEIKECFGTMANNILKIEVLNLSNNEIETITL